MDIRMEHYAQRLLNPFRGVVQVIRYGAAEAVSQDGLHWDLYVSNDDLRQGLEAGHAVQVSDIRYGAWSRETGLKRGSLYPSDDFRRMEMQGVALLRYLEALADQIPFPLRDDWERWLLDQEGHPLALLASALDGEDLDEGPVTWQPGYAAQAAFANPPGGVGENLADRLGRYLNDRAGASPKTRWFRRDAWGSDRDAFPELMLAETGHGAEGRLMVQAYLDWLAPWLLLLDGLTPERRADLEPLACRQASQVARLYRLYPTILAPDRIQAARVEDRLLASQTRQLAKDDAMSPFYIELNPTAGV